MWIMSYTDWISQRSSFIIYIVGTISNSQKLWSSPTIISYINIDADSCPAFSKPFLIKKKEQNTTQFTETLALTGGRSR